MRSILSRLDAAAPLGPTDRHEFCEVLRAEESGAVSIDREPQRLQLDVLQRLPRDLETPAHLARNFTPV